MLLRNNSFLLFTNRGDVEATVVSGAYGKRGNLDIENGNAPSPK